MKNMSPEECHKQYEVQFNLCCYFVLQIMCWKKKEKQNKLKKDSKQK